MNPMASFNTGAPGMASNAEVHNVNGAHITNNYNGPVHYHSCCSIHGCPNYTSIATPSSVIADPLSVSDDTAGLPVGDSQTVSSPGTSAMEVPITPPNFPIPVRKTGRIIANAKHILSRLIRALF
ncbi:hypothetical protein FIBSPDRAFT_1053732 [Athelia psychrophila]|uniref:Uncharacterized protein n=1 Tax=Athelia psychrophila TaxID=1759441 RepID=A0A167WHK9_9AGAM|nr:hypothetical protein FIBSPDRAFT_1053732 [Fibularhizoctonia sp. CBS 109695]